MALPAKKTTKTRTGKRRAHHALSRVTLTVCQKCKKRILPHRVCLNCGYYKQREVLKKGPLSSKKAKK